MWADGDVLVPLDGSSVAEHALPLAALVSKVLGRDARLMYVVNESEGFWTADDVNRARELFADYASRLMQQYGLRGSIAVEYGSPAGRILAASEGAAAVVIATHGRSGIRANLIGSVADKVIRGAKVPTFVAPGVKFRPPESPETRPILVALDGSEHGERALAFARHIRDAVGAPMVLLSAYRVPPPVTAEFAHYPAGIGETLERGLREYLDGIARPGEEKHVVMGEAAYAIVEAARALDAGLIVMGATGKGLARRLFLGSTTDRVVHTIDRTLLVIPPSAEVTAADQDSPAAEEAEQ